MSGLTRRQYLSLKRDRIEAQRAALLERVASLTRRLKQVRIALEHRSVLNYEQHETLGKLGLSISSDLRHLQREHYRDGSEQSLTWVEQSLENTHEQLAALEALVVSEVPLLSAL